MHYMTQCRAVKHLKKHIPRIFQDGFVLKLAKPYLVWKLGTRSTRWLRHFLRQGDIKLRQWDIKHDLFDTFGCAVLLGVYDHVGLLDDLSNAKRKDDSWFKTAHMTNVRIASSLRRNITGQNKNNPLGANIRLAQNLERCLLDLSILVFSPKGSLQDQNSIGKTVPRLKEDIHFFTDINQNMRQELEQFFNAFASVMNDESNSMEVTDLLKEGEELSDRILRFLLEKVSIN